MSTQDEDTEDELEPVSFQPRPNIITAFSADASPFEALSESVDNAIDHVRSRAYDGQAPQEDLEVTITFDAAESLEDSRIIIEDNAGGVSAGNLSRFFQWGASDTAPESIGRFGVGASRIAALGGVITYQSRARGQSNGFGFEVNVSEMADYEGEVTDDTYRADRTSVEDLNEGHTRIIVSDLNRSLIEILDIEPDSTADIDAFEDRTEVPDNQWDEAIERLADQFGDFFERYIVEGIQFDADYFPIDNPGVDVTVDVALELPDTEFRYTASPPPAIEYSYLPFDSLGPRQYTGLPFDEDDDTPSDEAAVRANIEVGLMLSADNEKAGLTLYANNRKILSRDTANPLFSTDYLGRYRSESGHSRLVIEVELQGDIGKMPVNSLKSDLDMNSTISDPLLRIIKNAAKRYRKQTYSSLPKWILNVYDADHPFAENGGAIQTFDKSSSTTNSARFRNQPGSSSGRRTFPERDRLRSIVKTHKALRIRDQSVLLPKEEPAYKQYYDTQYAGDVDDSEFTATEPVSVEGPDLEWSKISITGGDANLPVIKTIQNIAQQHMDLGGRADQTGELQPWQIPRYREELRKQTQTVDLDECGLTVWDEIPEDILIESLYRLTDQIGRIPNPVDMDESGLYSSNLYEERYGSWENSLEAADFVESSGPDEEGRGTNERSDKDEQSSSQLSEFSSDNETDATSEGTTYHSGISSETSDETSFRQRPSTETQSLDGTGIVIDGEYYKIPEEDLDSLYDLLGDTEDTDPEDAWEELKQVLEWYQQMPGR